MRSSKKFIGPSSVSMGAGEAQVTELNQLRPTDTNNNVKQTNHSKDFDTFMEKKTDTVFVNISNLLYHILLLLLKVEMCQSLKIYSPDCTIT